MRYPPAKEFAVRLVIGIVLLTGAPALAWFSSPATLDLQKRGERGAQAEISRKLFGLVPIGSEAITGISAVQMVRSREPGSQSDTPDRLVFATASGPVDLGYDQQRFARKFVAIRDFLQDVAQSRLTVSTIDEWNDRLVFLFAQFIAAVLVLIGILQVLGALALRRRTA